MNRYRVITILDIIHRSFLFKTWHFEDWILSLTSDGTYYPDRCGIRDWIAPRVLNKRQTMYYVQNCHIPYHTIYHRHKPIGNINLLGS
jgi:hypothetical protein